MSVSFALVHHANQYLITNGYENREGLADIVGSETGGKGILGALATHDAAGISINLHISGTLLEAIAWHDPDAIRKIRRHFNNGLIELVGSCYGQNIMRFFTPEYNLQQLNEELRLYHSLLGIPPARVRIFWPPERVWETRSMAPVLRDPRLLNDGYRFVIVDDRTLLSPRDPSLLRSECDQSRKWIPEAYRSYEIENGFGLAAFPIAMRLRRNIPPKHAENWRRVQAELEALLVHAAAEQDNVLALYADDMEKIIGVWGEDGPGCYAEFINWIAQSPWLAPVKLSDWAATHPPAGRRNIEAGTFAELGRKFHSGEEYENWFYSERAPYRRYFEGTLNRVNACRNTSADQSLIELAEKQLLLSSWETAWHTPGTGTHDEPADSGNPSAWARALTSHCRHALVTCEAARWMNGRNSGAHAAMLDADHDGEPDLLLKNDRLFALVSVRWGGRLVSLFYRGNSRSVMVIGNPSDDWNFLEELNRFMHRPRNHPGAFADVGFENDRYFSEILEQGAKAVVRLTNIEPGSDAFGMEKIYEFDSLRAELTVRYRLPASMKAVSVECALSPDYLMLLRHGSRIMTPIRGKTNRGFRTPSVFVALRTETGTHWERPEQEWIGHGRTLRIGSRRREFQLRILAGSCAADQPPADKEVA